MLKPEEIQSKEFEQSVIGGYRRDEVDSFLDSLESDYRKLYTENTELVEKLKVCLSKIEDYQKDEGFLKTAIINAQKLNETTLKEIELREKEVETSSKAKAAEIISEAEEQAKVIVLKAERESADAVRAAREQCRAEIEIEQLKANAEIARIQQEMEAEQNKLDHLRSQVAEFKNTIIELYKAHLTSISKLPEVKTSDDKNVPSDVPVKQEEIAEPVVAAQEPEQVAVQENQQEPIAEQEVASDDKTVEFKLSKKETKAEEKAEAKKPSKFENLKFGIDYDINKDN